MQLQRKNKVCPPNQKWSRIRKLPKLEIEEWIKKQTVFLPSNNENHFTIEDVLQQKRKKVAFAFATSFQKHAQRNKYPSEFSEGKNTFASLCKRKMSLCVANDIHSVVLREKQESVVNVVLLDNGWNTTKSILQLCPNRHLLHLSVVEATDREYKRMARTKTKLQFGKSVDEQQVRLIKGYLQNTNCFAKEEIDYLFADFCGGPGQFVDLIHWLQVTKSMKSNGRLVVTLCSRGWTIRNFLHFILTLPSPFPGAKLTNFIRYKASMFVFIFDNPELTFRGDTDLKWESLDAMYFLERRKRFVLS